MRNLYTGCYKLVGHLDSLSIHIFPRGYIYVQNIFNEENVYSYLFLLYSFRVNNGTNCKYWTELIYIFNKIGTKKYLGMSHLSLLEPWEAYLPGGNNNLVANYANNNAANAQRTPISLLFASTCTQFLPLEGKHDSGVTGCRAKEP